MEMRKTKLNKAPLLLIGDQKHYCLDPGNNF